ncbi:MAG: DUF2933 domain-containing protein [Chloroflexi bacterium]|nr:DUF2933 domain-containing protein [Chloroflexota bacterium]
MKKHHWGIMLLCCLVPLAGLAAIYLFDVPARSVLFIGLLLLCPLLHVWMMAGMHSRDGNHENHHPETPIPPAERQEFP